MFIILLLFIKENPLSARCTVSDKVFLIKDSRSRIMNGRDNNLLLKQSQNNFESKQLGFGDQNLDTYMSG